MWLTYQPMVLSHFQSIFRSFARWGILVKMAHASKLQFLRHLNHYFGSVLGINFK